MATADEEVNSSATTESELNDKILCSPCDSDGKILDAVGYCVDCKEYLCETCFKYHRLPTVTRKHVLLDKEQMGSMEGGNNRCPEHERRAIEYHCPTHGFFGCHVCCFQHQKTCKESIYIPEVAETHLTSEEFKEFSAKLDHISTKTKQFILDTKQKSEKVDNRYADEVDAVKRFKLQIIESIEKLEKDMLSKAKEFKRAENAKLDSILDKCTSIQEKCSAIATEIEILQNRHQNTDLYLAVVKSKDKVLSLLSDLNTIESDESMAVMLKFEANQDLIEGLKSPWGLGQFVNHSLVSSADHVTDINVKTGEDSSNCCIRGSATMPDGKLVIGDTTNNKVKLVDARKHKVVSEMKLSSSPHGVAKVTESTVAVTVPSDKKIVFVRTDPALSVDRDLDVKDSCHGVAYCEGKLVVTFRFSKTVKVMDLQGTVLREIETDQNGKALFPGPYTVSVDPEHGVMYVCNGSSGHNVKCLKLDGTLVATYADGELQYAQEASVGGNGIVFVFGYSSKNVHLITSDCKKVKVIITGLTSPETMSYDQNRKKLFISSQNNMKVFQVSYATL